jgi:uncharacterized protein (TIGR00251 family)
MLTVNETEEGVTFAIRVLPRSSKCELAGLQKDALRIRITAPPVEGRANEESIRFLAALFNVKRNQVVIKAGRKSKNKLIYIAGLTREDILAALPESCGATVSGLLF